MVIFVCPVAAEPVIVDSESSLRSLNVERGSPLVIVCTVQGVPFPQVVWYKAGRLVSNVANKIEISNRGQRLEVLKAKTNDAVDYQCFAKNSRGSTTRSFSVSVTGNLLRRNVILQKIYIK